MKRRKIVLRESLLLEAMRLGGETTYERIAEHALEEFINRRKARRILDLRGTGAWTGDLGPMRCDRPAVPRRG